MLTINVFRYSFKPPTTSTESDLAAVNRNFIENGMKFDTCSGRILSTKSVITRGVESNKQHRFTEHYTVVNS